MIYRIIIGRRIFSTIDSKAEFQAIFKGDPDNPENGIICLTGKNYKILQYHEFYTGLETLNDKNQLEKEMVTDVTVGNF